MKKYDKYYKLASQTLPNGKVKQVTEYIGKYYISQLSEKKLRRYKLYYMLLVLFSGAIAIGVGFLNHPGSRVVYVALPYVTLIIPITYSLMGIIGFIYTGKRLEQAVYDKTKIRIRSATIWQIALSCMTGLGNIVLTLIKESDDSLLKDWVFTGGMLSLLALSICFLQLQKRVIYEVEDKL